MDRVLATAAVGSRTIPNRVLTQAARSAEEHMERGAVDEDETIQVEHERLPVRHREGFEARFHFPRVGEVELPGDLHEDQVRPTGLALLENIGGRVSLQGRAAYEFSRASGLDGWRAGYAVEMAEAGGPSDASDEVRIEEERLDRGTVLVAVSGEADLRVAGELREQLHAVIDEHPSAVIVDLSDATLVDSTVLGVLVGTLKRMRSRGGHFRVVSPGGEIRRVLELTSLDRVFTLDRSRNDALAAVAPHRDRSDRIHV